MSLGEAKEEIKLSNDLWENSDSKAVREQMDTDFKYWGPYAFEMPKSQGKWTSVTTPSGKTLGNKNKGILQQSYMNLYIDVLEEERAKNKRIADTERLALGLINQANRDNAKRPSGVTLQDAFSFYAAIHGGTACSVLITEDKGKITPHITYYDPYGCQFIEGDEGIIWFCYRENKKRAYVERIYKKQIKEGLDVNKAGENGMVAVYTFWDDEEWKTAIGGKYVDGDKHGLGYVPVFVNPVGGVPPIMSEETDISKFAWQSVYVNSRELIPIESELLSIEMTKAKESGRVKGIASYDSSLSDGQVPEEINKLRAMREASPNRDTMAFLDKAKGEEFNGFVEAPDNRIVDQLLRTVRSYSSLAGLDPVTFGVFGEGSGAKASILRDAALEFTHPFFKNEEDTFVWIAEEEVRQFKTGNYPQVEVVGRDIHEQPFMVKIKVKDVEEHYFSCNLKSNKLRDEAVELGIEIQKLEAGIGDKRSSISRFSPDPDRTLEMIEQEKHADIAARDPIYHNLEMAKWYKDKGDEVMAGHHLWLVEMFRQIEVQGLTSQLSSFIRKPSIQGQTPPGAMGQPDVTAEAARVAAEPMTNIANSIQAEVRQ